MGRAIVIGGKIYYKYGWCRSWKDALQLKAKYPRAKYYFQKCYNPRTKQVSYDIYLRKKY